MSAPRDADADPGREIAKLALADTYGQPGEMLESVIERAFDQLCWHRTDPQLEGLIERLRALLTA